MKRLIASDYESIQQDVIDDEAYEKYEKDFMAENSFNEIEEYMIDLTTESLNNNDTVKNLIISHKQELEQCSSEELIKTDIFDEVTAYFKDELRNIMEQHKIPDEWQTKINNMSIFNYLVSEIIYKYIDI